MGKKTRARSGMADASSHTNLDSSGSSPPNVIAGPSHLVSAQRDPLDLTQYEELSQRYEALQAQFAVVQAQCSALARSMNESPNSQPLLSAPAPRVEVITHKDPIPPFTAETPAAQPLRRNQEIETWIRRIENSTSQGSVRRRSHPRRAN